MNLLHNPGVNQGVSRRSHAGRAAVPSSRKKLAVLLCGLLVALAAGGAFLAWARSPGTRLDSISRMLHGQSPFNPDAVKSSEYSGVPTVGTFITEQRTGWNGRSCNGTVIPSPGHNLIATAAHCIASYDGVHGLRFAPQWHDGKAPFGTFPFLPGRTYTDPRYLQGRSGYRKEPWDLDVAFVTVGPNEKGQQVQDAVGGYNKISFDAPPTNDTTVIGYPARLKYPIHCRAKSSPFKTEYQQIACAGFTGGTSGAPWFTDWDARSSTGTLIGVLGGYMRGGNSSDLEYGTRFGPDIAALYHEAAAGLPQSSAGGMGGPARWRGAAGIASGDLSAGGHAKVDDLVARFKDGSVRVFRGNSGGGFHPGVLVQGPNAVWRNVTAFTVGDFGGGGHHSDVLAVQKDGSVLLYRDAHARPGGLGRPELLQGPDPAWAGVRAVAAGPFAGGRYANQLLAVGADGTVTLHGGVGTRQGALASGTVLGGPSKEWRTVRSLAAASLPYNGGTKKHADGTLLALFGNGAVKAYAGLSAKHGSPAKGALLARPNPERSHLVGIAAGRWIGLKPAGHIPDDLVALWRNGAVVMHQNMNLRGFVREFQLVAPAKPAF